LELGTQQENNTKTKFQDIPHEDQEKIKMVLHIMDRFCIGDAAYLVSSGGWLTQKIPPQTMPQ
jgi:hypothetical protein